MTDLPYEGTSVKELISEEFRVWIKIEKSGSGFLLKRVTVITVIEDCTYMRHLPLTTSLKLNLINNQKISSTLSFFKRDRKPSIEIILDGDDKLRQLITNCI